jgi:tetratricopeptide (TPR) repeat protein
MEIRLFHLIAFICIITVFDGAASKKIVRKKSKLKSADAPMCMATYPDMFSLTSFEAAKDLTLQGFSKFQLKTKSGRKKAIALWKKAAATSALALDARHMLAFVEYNNGNVKEAVDIWNNSLNMMSDMHSRNSYAEPWDTVMTDSSFVHGTPTIDALAFKLRHDAEQLQYLSSLEIWSEVASSAEEYESLIETYETISEQLLKMRPQFMRPGNEHGFMSLKHEVLDGAMGGIWGRMWLKQHQLKLPDLAPQQRVVREKSAEEMALIMETFRRDRVVVVDDLLTDEALYMAREALLRCPVWHEVKPWGYLGAYPSSGLTVAHPVFLAIGQQLPQFFQQIFDTFLQQPTDAAAAADFDKEEDSDALAPNPYELNMVWAYKYDNSGSDTERAGIGVHADEALVNINIWLTPDSANRERQGDEGVGVDGGGGLIVYKDLAPPGWSMYDNTERDVDHSNNVRDQWVGRDNITVGYRQNRMVLFDSERYHRTASFNFKKGYKNRRINLTYLFGTRQN